MKDSLLNEVKDIKRSIVYTNNLLYEQNLLTHKVFLYGKSFACAWMVVTFIAVLIMFLVKVFNL